MIREIHFHIMLGAGTIRGALTAGLLAALSAPLGSESITLTTYYPAPVGIYKKMTTTGQTTLARDGGAVGIGTTNPASAAVVDMTSTSRGFLPPRLTTAQRDAIASPVAGLTVYNATTKQLELHDGTSWKSAGGGSGAQAAGYACIQGGLYVVGGRCGGRTYTNNSGKNRLVVITAMGMSDFYSNNQIVSRGIHHTSLVPPNGTYSVLCGANSQMISWTEYDF